jgi:hypothetical protein
MQSLFPSEVSSSLISCISSGYATEDVKARAAEHLVRLGVRSGFSHLISYISANKSYPLGHSSAINLNLLPADFLLEELEPVLYLLLEQYEVSRRFDDVPHFLLDCLYVIADRNEECLILVEHKLKELCELYTASYSNAYMFTWYAKNILDKSRKKEDQLEVKDALQYLKQARMSLN